MSRPETREVVILDRHRARVEPDGEPAIVAFARVLDTVLAADTVLTATETVLTATDTLLTATDTVLAADDDGTDPFVHLIDDDLVCLMFGPTSAVLTTLPEMEPAALLDYASREHALALAAEFLAGDLDALRSRPWAPDPPGWRWGDVDDTVRTDPLGFARRVAEQHLAYAAPAPAPERPARRPWWRRLARRAAT